MPATRLAVSSDDQFTSRWVRRESGEHRCARSCPTVRTNVSGISRRRAMVAAAAQRWPNAIHGAPTRERDIVREPRSERGQAGHYDRSPAHLDAAGNPVGHRRQHLAPTVESRQLRGRWSAREWRESGPATNMCIRSPRRSSSTAGRASRREGLRARFIPRDFVRLANPT
jgi:hypothetical protein